MRIGITNSAAERQLIALGKSLRDSATTNPDS